MGKQKTIAALNTSDDKRCYIERYNSGRGVFNPKSKMAQRTNNILIDEKFSKTLKKTYITNKINVYHFDDTWSLDILDLKGYGPEINRAQRYVLVLFDKFSKFG